MPIGTRHRLKGLLLDRRRGLVLQVDDGGVWALDTEPEANRLVGRRVVVEGTRSGFDRLDVEWIDVEQSDAFHRG
ncbi:MAG: DUF5818 domain-containing protein [Pseudomonadota bacterium]|nr:DUF5818 domain-containing protein [Pseudomonadota bacterium]